MYIEIDSWHVTPWRICTTWLVFLVLDRIDFTDSMTQAEVNEHLEIGRDFLARGQLSDALPHYHAAVEGDPGNYLTLYKRSMVYFALGKARQAIADLDKAITMKPDFMSAILQRGNIYFKQAKFEEALTDFETVLHYDPNNIEAYDNYHKIHPVSEDVKAAKMYNKAKDHHSAVQVLHKVIEMCPWSSELRLLRADSHSALGDITTAIADIKTTTKLESDNTAGFYKLSLLHYDLGQAAESLIEIRECLKLDPEHKDCFPHYKKVKKVDKLMRDIETAVGENDFKSCIDYAKKILLAETSVSMVLFYAHQKLCHCYLHDDQLSLSVASCREALDLHKDPVVYCERAEAYINNELYDDAIRDYQSALELDPEMQRAKEGIQRAQRLQKQSERRDYYKILNVPRSASKKEVIKAYRKQAQKWHPDNFPDGDEKKVAEKKFIDIAAAKEVLTDPEKKQKFDNGEDPLDPESGQYAHGGFPFSQGFHHFHGSPFTFKFHYT